MAKSHEIARTGNALKLSADKIVMLPVSEVRPYEKNPRKNANAVKFVKASIEQFGFNVPIIIDSNRVIVCGHTRLLAAKSLGMSEVPCIMADDLTDDQIRAFRLADNKVGEFAEWDMDLLGDELDAIADACDIDMGDFGFDLSGDDEEMEVVEDEVPEEVEPVCKKGELWQLGEHRLMCGDSTSADDVAKLMNGERADIAFTSPPYGVNDGSIRKHQEKGKSDHEAKNFYLEHDDNQSTWPQLVEETWQRMHENTDQQFINIQMLADNKRELVKWCARHADNLCDILIWDKGHAAPQMQPNIVSNNYENIYVFGDDKCSRTLKYGNFHGTFGAIIRVGVGQNEYADIHKAVFPVALPAEILNINGNAKSVLDLFGGTGTTMIAAEQLGRKCYMMELDPHYCDVIIARWEKLTGQKAVKLEG